MTPPRGDKHWVYLHIDAGGDCLYVGATNDRANRLMAHRYYAPWWPEIDDVVHIGPFDRRTALGIERELIAELDPPANSHGTSRDSRKPENRPRIVHRPDYAQIRGATRTHYAGYWGRPGGDFRSLCARASAPRSEAFTSEAPPDCKGCQWIGTTPRLAAGAA